MKYQEAINSLKVNEKGKAINKAYRNCWDNKETNKQIFLHKQDNGELVVVFHNNDEFQCLPPFKPYELDLKAHDWYVSNYGEPVIQGPKNEDYNPDFHVIESRIDEKGIFIGQTESRGTITLMPVAAFNDADCIGKNSMDLMQIEILQPQPQLPSLEIMLLHKTLNNGE